ncbi:MAG TPA: helix-turn-helix transcriptional regulator [Fimbriimonadaceae bacterium]|jgi:DNA-binding XRE family transcriptional regulator
MADELQSVVPYPNKLRDHREGANLTRRQLSALCTRLADQDNVLHTGVSIPTIQKLERGLAQPRSSTARTISEALKADVQAVFTAGIDTKNRKI